ncbi:MAG: hypothetical protein UH625_07240 [Muribaculaceae bacterium]|nr:hypothetical protein [Muribaculaceae bacterium]
MLSNFLTLLIPAVKSGAHKAAGAKEALATIPGIEFPIMWAGIVFVVLLLIAIFASLSVAYRPSGTDNTTRKIIFWVFAFLTPIAAFVVNLFTCHVYSQETFDKSYQVERGVNIAEKFSELLTNISIIALVSFVLFVLVGFILSKAFKSSKLGSWF